jgi:hypothetical protein
MLFASDATVPFSGLAMAFWSRLGQRKLGKGAGSGESSNCEARKEGRSLD